MHFKSCFPMMRTTLPTPCTWHSQKTKWRCICLKMNNVLWSDSCNSECSLYSFLILRNYFLTANFICQKWEELWVKFAIESQKPSLAQKNNSQFSLKSIWNGIKSSDFLKPGIEYLIEVWLFKTNILLVGSPIKMLNLNQISNNIYSTAFGICKAF